MNGVFIKESSEDAEGEWIEEAQETIVIDYSKV